MLGYDLWAMAATSSGNIAEAPSVIPLIARDDQYMGAIPRAMKYIFSAIQTVAGTVTVEVSYLELYNDMKIIDLLRLPDSESRLLEIRESKGGEIVIPGLNRRTVNDTNEVLDALWSGAKIRHVAATDMNDYSSRSHTVFIVYMTVLGEDAQILVNSKLSFVDLAGSEKWKSSQLATFSVERVKELTSINRSLSALGNCVSALLQKNRGHIPYRDSKLTRLLQDSLGGNALTLFIVTLSPSVQNVEESASTLQFADRAMKVQILVTKNQTISSSQSVDSLKAEIRNLKTLLNSTMRHMGDDSNPLVSTSSLNETLSVELQTLQDENMRLLLQLKSTQEDLTSSQEENRSLLIHMQNLQGQPLTQTDDSALEKCSPSSKRELLGFSENLQMSIIKARGEVCFNIL